MSHSLEEWLNKMSLAKPIQIAPPEYVVSFDSHGFIDLFNEKIREYYREGYYEQDDYWEMVHNYFMNSSPAVRTSYYYFLYNTAKIGPPILKKSTSPPVPKTPIFTDTTIFSYGMLTFTSPNGHFGNDDEKAIEYFDKIYETYLKPDSEFRRKNNFKANIWLEVKDGVYYHVHMVYRCKKGTWLECNKGTLKKNRTILFNMNNQTIRKIRCQDDIKHIDNWIKYSYNEPGNRVVKNYTAEFDKVL